MTAEKSILAEYSRRQGIYSSSISTPNLTLGAPTATGGGPETPAQPLTLEVVDMCGRAVDSHKAVLVVLDVCNVLLRRPHQHELEKILLC